MRRRTLLPTLLLPLALTANAAEYTLDERLARSAEAIQPKAIAWRHDIHQHPELGNQEHRTAALVAEHLRHLGMEVETGVGTTGVVGLLKGGRPGPVVALRADMDALPVLEATGLPFASQVRQQYQGEERPVMHACGHDAHVAILMATAEVLAGLKDELPGSVKFIFQPAEEGPSDYVYDGQRHFGARQLVEAGVMENPDVAAVFGLHVTASMPTGLIGYRSGPVMASSGDLHIRVQGKQTHGAQPWDGVDPIVTSAQIINGLQTIVSRQTNIMPAPAVVTIGTINGGSRHNIIPDEVVMTGTVRTFGDQVQQQVNERIERTARGIAEAAGASADVRIVDNYLTTTNHPTLTEQMVPTLQRAAHERVVVSPMVTGSEDFSYYANEAPGLFVFLGVTPMARMGKAAPNHAPGFIIDDAALLTGVRTLSMLASDYLQQARSAE
ncbi:MULTISPECIES: amidohydrolase [Pseudomonas]|jgi:amidohydrolase|uniref:N-acyl-L-amino acid amidohydrolase n=1 Tax=Pseudomonas abyssi TaxID=170540 RepID=A0A2A3MFI8_9PSED|nr:amidohydrolase [Pseudomonas abyssi]MAD00893.1 amidohydrolase [Pseudomonadales bacterium]PBK03579.1 N-acyl-L-amino acid amidohydrolase [Pseudomonas abyssi]|tara:strand:- start:147 stop:1469 length:1323 start_codon:yes stop_codon:yes gene_type:complete